MECPVRGKRSETHVARKGIRAVPRRVPRGRPRAASPYNDASPPEGQFPRAIRLDSSSMEKLRMTKRAEPWGEARNHRDRPPRVPGGRVGGARSCASQSSARYVSEDGGRVSPCWEARTGHPPPGGRFVPEAVSAGVGGVGCRCRAHAIAARPSSREAFLFSPDSRRSGAEEAYQGEPAAEHPPGKK